MFTYLLTQRPPSIGTHPTENLKETKETTFRNRICYLLFYSQELTQDQIKKFELTPDYRCNSLKPHEFTFAGEQHVEIPALGKENEIVTFMNGDQYHKYSYMGWFNRITQ